MPISDLGCWTLPSQPCFQLYGTKRKNTDEGDPMRVQREPDFPIAKRKCFLPIQEQKNTNLSANEFPCIENSKIKNSNNMSDGSQYVKNSNTLEEQFTNESYDEVMDSEMEETPMPQEHHHPDICQQQREMSQEYNLQRQLLIKRTEKLKEQLTFIREHSVESNDYWAPPSDHQLTMEDELEQARIQMESDFAPDPYQYKHNGPETIPMMDYDVRSKVRCYCKPTWEGVMNQNCYI